VPHVCTPLLCPFLVSTSTTGLCGSTPVIDMADEALENALSGMSYENADGDAMTYVSYRSLEPDRQKVMASIFPECGDGSKVYAVIASGSEGQKKEFIVAVQADSTGGPPTTQQVTGSCQITFEDLSPADCVEYCFPEAPGQWAMAQLSKEALETYRGMKFESWKQMLLKPTCEAQFRRMLQIGMITQLFDPNVFPTPESMKSMYQVTDEKTGKQIQLPHPVSELRIWNVVSQKYDTIDPQLKGAPSEAEKATWWDNFIQQLKKDHGDEYILSLMGNK